MHEVVLSVNPLSTSMQMALKGDNFMVTCLFPGDKGKFAAPLVNANADFVNFKLIIYEKKLKLTFYAYGAYPLYTDEGEPTLQEAVVHVSEVHGSVENGNTAGGLLRIGKYLVKHLHAALVARDDDGAMLGARTGGCGCQLAAYRAA